MSAVQAASAVMDRRCSFQSRHGRNLSHPPVSQPHPFMKPVRLLLILLGVFLALVLVAGGVALVPAVQRWAVLRAARGTPGLKFEAATVAAGLNRLSLAGVK